MKKRQQKKTVGTTNGGDPEAKYSIQDSGVGGILSGMNSLYCHKPLHNGKQCRYFCSEPACKEEPLCEKCIEAGGHKEHAESLKPLEQALEMEFAPGEKPQKKLKLPDPMVQSLIGFVDGKESTLESYSESVEKERLGCLRQLDALKAGINESIEEIKSKVNDLYNSRPAELAHRYNMLQYILLMSYERLPPRMMNFSLTNSQETYDFIQMVIKMKYKGDQNDENSRDLANTGNMPGRDTNPILVQNSIQEMANYLPALPPVINGVNQLDKMCSHLLRSFSAMVPEVAEHPRGTLDFSVPVLKNVTNLQKPDFLSPDSKQKNDALRLMANSFPEVKMVPMGSSVPDKLINKTTSLPTIKISRRLYLTGLSKITCLAWIAPGFAAFGCDNGLIEYWDIERGRVISILRGHPTSIRYLLYTKCGVLLSASTEGTILSWSVDTMCITGVLEGHTEQVCHMIELENGYIVSCSQDRTIKIWDLSNEVQEQPQRRKPIKTIVHKNQNAVFCLAQLPFDSLRFCWDDFKSVAGLDSSRQHSVVLLAAASRCDIVLWLLVFQKRDVQPTMLRVLKGMNGYIRTLHVFEDYTLISGGSDGSLKVWSIKTGQLVKQREKAHNNAITSILDGFGQSSQQQGQRLVATASFDTSIKLWDLNDVTKEVQAINNGHKGFIFAMQRDPFHARRIVSVGEDKTLFTFSY